MGFGVLASSRGDRGSGVGHPPTGGVPIYIPSRARGIVWVPFLGSFRQASPGLNRPIMDNKQVLIQ